MEGNDLRSVKDIARRALPVAASGIKGVSQGSCGYPHRARRAPGCNTIVMRDP